MATAKKAAAPKTAAKKPAAKKPAAAKAAVKNNIVLQYGDKSVSYDEIAQDAKNVWVYDLGHKESEITSMDLYVKPEEDRVYYVINETTVGSFAI